MNIHERAVQKLRDAGVEREAAELAAGVTIAAVTEMIQRRPFESLGQLQVVPIDEFQTTVEEPWFKVALEPMATLPYLDSVLGA